MFFRQRLLLFSFVALGVLSSPLPTLSSDSICLQGLTTTPQRPAQVVQNARTQVLDWVGEAIRPADAANKGSATPPSSPADIRRFISAGRVRFSEVLETFQNEPIETLLEESAHPLLTALIERPDPLDCERIFDLLLSLKNKHVPQARIHFIQYLLIETLISVTRRHDPLSSGVPRLAEMKLHLHQNTLLDATDPLSLDRGFESLSSQYLLGREILEASTRPEKWAQDGFHF